MSDSDAPLDRRFVREMLDVFWSSADDVAAFLQTHKGHKRAVIKGIGDATYDRLKLLPAGAVATAVPSQFSADVLDDLQQRGLVTLRDVDGTPQVALTPGGALLMSAFLWEQAGQAPDDDTAPPTRPAPEVTAADDVRLKARDILRRLNRQANR